MFTTVNITEQSFVPYSWDDTSFAWDSERANTPWDEIGVCSFLLAVEEGVSISENHYKYYKKVYGDSFNISEYTDKKLNKYLNDNLKFSDAYTDYIQFTIRHYETIQFEDKIPKSIYHVIKDVFRISDFNRKDFNKYNYDKIILSDKMTRSSIKRFKENIKYADNMFKGININKEESFSLADSIYKRYGLHEYQPFSLSDAVKRTNKFDRKFFENLNISDLIKKRMVVPKKETFEMWDAFPLCANATISDLAFYNTVLTEKEFLEQDNPVGYALWKEFIPGDWTYQKALFKLIISNTGTQGSPTIENWQLNIDVPDVYEKQAVTVPAKANYRIDFGRRFYAIPDVTVSVRGNQGLLVNDLQIDELGLSLTLRDGDGNIAGGEIYIRAEGY